MRISDFIKQYKSTQFIKYLFVGGLNFIFGLVVFYLFLKVLLVSYVIALTITWALGVLLTYVINFIWVFRPETGLNFRSYFFKYIFVQSICFGVNILCLRLVVQKTKIDPFYVQLALLPLIVVFNFLVTKLWALRPGVKPKLRQ